LRTEEGPDFRGIDWSGGPGASTKQKYDLIIFTRSLNFFSFDEYDF
jgi:hypothetical protein